MSTQLQQFADTDAGFRQFCERYKRVAANPETRREYYDWVHEQMREQGMLAAAREEGELRGERRGELRGIRKGELRGIRKGELRGRLEVARNALHMGLTPEQIAQLSGLPLGEVMKLTRAETEKPVKQ